MSDAVRIALGCVLALSMTLIGAGLVQPDIPPTDLALAGTLATAIAALYGLTRRS